MATLKEAAFSPSPERVRVMIPHDVAYDLKKMQTVTATVLGKLGCPGCHSGRILDFVQIRDFVIDAKTLDVQEIVAGFGR